jgi:hypothetical protein
VSTGDWGFKDQPDTRTELQSRSTGSMDLGVVGRPAFPNGHPGAQISRGKPGIRASLEPQSVEATLEPGFVGADVLLHPQESQVLNSLSHPTPPNTHPEGVYLSSVLFRHGERGDMIIETILPTLFSVSLISVLHPDGVISHLDSIVPMKVLPSMDNCSNDVSIEGWVLENPVLPSCLKVGG